MNEQTQSHLEDVRLAKRSEDRSEAGHWSHVPFVVIVNKEREGLMCFALS